MARYTAVDYFTGLNAGESHPECRLVTFMGREVRGLLHIAGMHSQDICLCLEEDHYGEIYFLDRIDECVAPLDECCDQICGSFLEFLQGLTFPEPNRLETMEEEARETSEPFSSVILGDLVGVERFLREGGDINCRDEDAQTPLIVAVSRRWPRIARALVERGADVHARDNEGRTAFHHAAMEGSVERMEMLLAHGADPLQQDHEGENGLMLASTGSRSEESVALIRDHLEQRGIAVDYEEQERRCLQVP